MNEQDVYTVFMRWLVAGSVVGAVAIRGLVHLAERNGLHLDAFVWFSIGVAAGMVAVAVALSQAVRKAP